LDAVGHIGSLASIPDVEHIPALLPMIPLKRKEKRISTYSNGISLPG
jgi:hypothetical protein